jgi:serine/threonine-protein kinase
LVLPAGQQLTVPRQAIAISPDGTRVAYAADGRLYIRAISELEPRALPGADPAISPVFSPDGQWVLFWAESMLKRISVNGGTAVPVCRASPSPSGATWSDAGILFALPTKGILRVSPNGGEPEVIVPTDASGSLAQGPQLLPGGDAVMFTLSKGGVATAVIDRWDTAQIVVQSLKTGARKTLLVRGTDARYVPTGHIVYAVSGTLFAVPFDLARLEVTSGPIPVVEGVRRVNVATVGSAQFAVSDTGTLVYVPGPASMGQQDLFLFDRKGAGEPLKLPPANYVFPRVSRDGKRLVFETNDGKEAVIAVYDLSGASFVRRLTFGGNNRFPIWSADGRRVAFQSDREGDLAVWWQPADGGTAERLTRPDKGTSHRPESWSPTTDAFLFSVAKATESALWMFSLRDRKASPFGDVTSTTFPPDADFSPDGKWVAYQVGRTDAGEANLFVQPFPPDGQKYQIGFGGRPAWSRDGRELFFVPAPSRFMMVTVKTQPSFTFTRPAAVPRGFGIADPASPRPYDLMPDGRILGTGSNGGVQGSPGEIHVVLNWFEELKARVPVKRP